MRKPEPHQPVGIGTLFAVVLGLLGLMLLVLHGRQFLGAQGLAQMPPPAPTSSGNGPPARQSTP